jgi:hypothetical protein
VLPTLMATPSTTPPSPPEQARHAGRFGMQHCARSKDFLPEKASGKPLRAAGPSPLHQKPAQGSSSVCLAVESKPRNHHHSPTSQRGGTQLM